MWSLLPLFLIVACPVDASPTKQKFANQPSAQTAVVGSTVVLPCRVIGIKGTLQWTRDGFGLGNERELYAFKRYTMIGSDEEGSFNFSLFFKIF